VLDRRQLHMLTTNSEVWHCCCRLAAIVMVNHSDALFQPVAACFMLVAMCVPCSPLFLVHSTQMWERKLDTKALMAWNDDTVVLSFRGTASFRNVLSDIKVRARSAAFLGFEDGSGQPAPMAGLLQLLQDHCCCGTTAATRAAGTATVQCDVALAGSRTQSEWHFGDLMTPAIRCLQAWYATHPPKRGKWYLGTRPFVHQVTYPLLHAVTQLTTMLCTSGSD